MTASSGTIRSLIFHAAKTAFHTHPKDAAAACTCFVEQLAEAGVRISPVPEVVRLSFVGAMERSLGDPRGAAWRIQSDLAPMATWLGWRLPQERRHG